MMDSKFWRFVGGDDDEIMMIDTLPYDEKKR
jgi:hypothetical protein